MSLFWKIFLGFWLTVLLTAATSFWVVTVLRHDQDSALHGELAKQFTRLQENLRQGGGTALLLHSDQGIESPDELMVATEDDQLLWPTRASDTALELLPRLSADNPALKDIHHNFLSVGVQVDTDDGQIFKIIARQPLPPPHKQGWLIIVALVISTLACWLITRLIVMPLKQLSKTAGQFASGDLDARATSGSRVLGNDELDQLAADFNDMADKLKQSVIAHNQLLHDVSHELRSPITRIRLAAELMRGKNDRLDPAIHASLARVDRECQSLDELISELLILPRLDAQPLPRDEQVDLIALLKDRVDAARLEADAASKKLELQIDDSGSALSHALLVQGSAHLLARTMDNLLNNALRYSPADGLIQVNVSHTDSDILLSVQDRGPGVPEADLQRIFEPFVRVETARERRGTGGFGLGLALVKKIVLAHGGSVKASNTFPGLRVEVRLPIRPNP